jgi:hypothetical protein
MTFPIFIIAVGLSVAWYDPIKPFGKIFGVCAVLAGIVMVTTKRS